MMKNDDKCACLSGSCPPCMGRCRCVFQKQEEPKVGPAALAGAFSVGIIVTALFLLIQRRIAGLFRRRPAI